MKPLLVVLCAAAVIGAAGAAHADPNPPGGSAADNTAFFAALQAAGITYGRSDLVIATAEAVCTSVSRGTSGPELVAALQERNPGLTTEHAGQFLAIALRSYCPQQLPPGKPGGGE